MYRILNCNPKDLCYLNIFVSDFHWGHPVGRVAASGAISNGYTKEAKRRLAEVKHVFDAFMYSKTRGSNYPIGNIGTGGKKIKQRVGWWSSEDVVRSTRYSWFNLNLLNTRNTKRGLLTGVPSYRPWGKEKHLLWSILGSLNHPTPQILRCVTITTYHSFLYMICTLGNRPNWKAQLLNCLHALQSALLILKLRCIGEITVEDKYTKHFPMENYFITFPKYHIGQFFIFKNWEWKCLFR